MRRGTPDRSRRWLRLRRIGASRVAPPPRDDRPFELTAEDLVGLEPGLGKPPVYLGHFTRHGVELLLEQSGFLDQLRARGFRRLRVDLDPSQGIGQTLRAVCEDRPEGELLVELRVDRSLATVPGHEVLDIEWLLLQNPRESFTERRPALPGQQHPGLGVLREVLGLLVVVCEKHGLDGIAFTAAHYHVAMLGRGLVRFLRPQDEARTRALGRALEGLPLAGAAAALEEGRVVAVADGSPVDWTAATMVLPVSERLRQRLFGEDYDAAVESEARHFTYRLEERTGREARPC